VGRAKKACPELAEGITNHLKSLAGRGGAIMKEIKGEDYC